MNKITLSLLKTLLVLSVVSNVDLSLATGSKPPSNTPNPPSTPSNPTTPTNPTKPTPPDANDEYSYVDPKGLIPSAPKKIALAYYDQKKASLANKTYLTIIDFSQYSGKKRMYIIDMRSGEVEAVKTAHGSKSDPGHDGYAESFSNVSGSNKSSLGWYKTAETYSGKHGYSLKLDGLSSTNSNARARAIVIHAADYVDNGTTAKSGRSWGCPALDPDVSRRIITAIKGGSLIYAHYK